MNRVAAGAVTIVTGAVLGGCASTPASGGSPAHTPTATASATARPTPTPIPVPRGPFGVVVTNSGRSGTTYGVLLVDVNAKVVAQATGNLPLIKPNQSVDLPLVSASATKVYYRSGDTDIYSLAPDGTTALVRRIPDGASAELATAGTVQVCVCPCDSAGHRSTCTVSIKPGQEMWMAQLDGYGPRTAVICAPCWTAINGESGQ